ncbi:MULTISPECIES: M48 family metalloprotease [unclassified Polaromonas]|uniref:M48 family metalloprotease n=1 Tax=unclassified Polaromonas TaxID=2638319 RepID=UPI000F08E2E5|nr:MULTISPECIES: M48 family metalloprotease [unclassified Polaromonas]AYQ28074.1 peptidase M48 [Polaromonas sp. SP1]QGJ17062.1 M48 family metalloprotease [Polaromonas sp. Pch-P]
MRFFERQEAARAQTTQLLVLFALTVLALVVAVNAALALTWRIVTPGFSGYPAYFFAVNTGMTLLFVLGGWWLETSALQGGGERLARRAGAREAWPASREAERKLCNIVSELAIAAGMKPPLAMVLDREEGINAFAAGWDEGDAVVAVTRGALEHLTRDELQGLVAHEFSHLREGDTRLNMRLAGMVFGLEMIFNLGRSMCEADGNGQRSFLALPGFAIKVTGSLGWLAGRALKAAVSRQREFLADARAVQFTRSRDGLGGVLRKVVGQQEQGGLVSRTLHPAVQHMLLVGASADARWFASHPPLPERIRRIYGRPMTALPARRDDEMATRPGAIF